MPCLCGYLPNKARFGDAIQSQQAWSIYDHSFIFIYPDLDRPFSAVIRGRDSSSQRSIWPQRSNFTLLKGFFLSNQRLHIAIYDFFYKQTLQFRQTRSTLNISKVVPLSLRMIIRIPLRRLLFTNPYHLQTLHVEYISHSSQ